MRAAACSTEESLPAQKPRGRSLARRRARVARRLDGRGAACKQAGYAAGNPRPRTAQTLAGAGLAGRARRPCPAFRRARNRANPGGRRAAQNILLAAHALGLGAIWRTGAPAYSDDVARALGLPAQSRIVAFIYLGAPHAPAIPSAAAEPPSAVDWGATPREFPLPPRKP